ncbi:15709_t:CDS:2, partial [Cetraspora pellucida]
MDGNNLQEIDEKLDLFMATWTNGIRTIKYESGMYTRSRNESRIDLIKLHNSQTNTSEVIKKIRTIKNESGGYARSRTKSRVDLIKLHNSQTNTLDFIKKLNEMMKEKYKIYGITRDENEQYMIVLDYYFNKRDIKKYGE